MGNSFLKTGAFLFFASRYNYWGSYKPGGSQWLASVSATIEWWHLRKGRLNQF
jgi:hypothetical protein